MAMKSMFYVDSQLRVTVRGRFEQDNISTASKGVLEYFQVAPAHQKLNGLQDRFFPESFLPTSRFTRPKSCSSKWSNRR